jgi:hypothetical protein
MLFATPAAKPVFNTSRLFIFVFFVPPFVIFVVNHSTLSTGRLPAPNHRLFAVTTTRLSVAIRASAHRASLTNGKPIKKYMAAVKIPTPI